MICLPLMSLQGFSCSFATLLILMERLRCSSTSKGTLIHQCPHMKVNNWISYDETLSIRHQSYSRFCTFLHVLLSQLSCYLVTSEMYLLHFLLQLQEQLGLNVTISSFCLVRSHVSS